MSEESSSPGRSLDLLNLYLHDVSRLPPLKARSELALLARRIQRGAIACAYIALCAQSSEQRVIRSILEAASTLLGPTASNSVRSTDFANLGPEIDRFYVELRPGDDARIRSAAGPAPDGDSSAWESRMEEAWQAFHALSLAPTDSRVELLTGGRIESETFAMHLRDVEREGAEARRQLVEGTLRWPLKVARGHVGKGVPYLDLVQEGYFGLNEACDKFREWKGTHFQSYAVTWIRQRIARYIADHARLVRVPVHVVELVQADAAEREAWADHHGALPSSLEFALHQGWLTSEHISTLASIGRVRIRQARRAEFERLRSSLELLEDGEHASPEQIILLDVLADLKMMGNLSPSCHELMHKMSRLSDAEIECLRVADEPETVARHLAAAKAWSRFVKWRDRDSAVNGFVHSLEHAEWNLTDGRRYKLRNCLVDDAQDPQQPVHLSVLRNTLEGILDQLNEREKEVLTKRFGLADGLEWTLEEVGQKFGCTRERIRQIEAKALRKLRHPLRTRRLRAFYTTSDSSPWSGPTLDGSTFSEALDRAEAILRQQAEDDLYEERALIDALLNKYALAPRKWAPVTRLSGRAEVLREILLSAGQPLHYDTIHERAEQLLPDEWAFPKSRTYATLFYHRYFQTYAGAVFGLAEWSATGKTASGTMQYCPQPFVSSRGEARSFFESIWVGGELLSRNGGMTADHFYAEMMAWAQREMGSVQDAQQAFDSWAAAGLLERIEYATQAHERVIPLLPRGQKMAEMRVYCLNQLCQRIEKMPETILVVGQVAPATTKTVQRVLFGSAQEGFDVPARLAMLAAFDAVRNEHGAWVLTTVGQAALEANPAQELPDFGELEEIDQAGPLDELLDEFGWEDALDGWMA